MLCTVFLLLAYTLGGRQLKIEWVVSVLGGAGGLTTFLYSQREIWERELASGSYYGFSLQELEIS